MNGSRLDQLDAFEWDALEDVTYLLPTGSTEQHGSHLPVGTDTAIAVAVCEAACGRAEDLMLVPAIPYGVSDHHKRLPGGAISAGPNAFADYLGAVVLELVNASRRRAVLILNGHGGNWPSIVFTLDRLGSAHGELPVGACSWWDLVGELIAGVDPNVPTKRPGHAGAVETSVMLALEPGAVRPQRSIANPARPAGPPLQRWLDFSLHFPTGIIGTPSMASSELGRKVVDAASERLVDLARVLREQSAGDTA